MIEKPDSSSLALATIAILGQAPSLEGGSIRGCNLQPATFPEALEYCLSVGSSAGLWTSCSMSARVFSIDCRALVCSGFFAKQRYASMPIRGARELITIRSRVSG